MVVKLSRNDLLNSVKRAINVTKAQRYNLSREDEDKIINAAKTVKRVITGTPEFEDSKCIVAAAGLWKSSIISKMNEGVFEVACQWDSEIRRLGISDNKYDSVHIQIIDD